jgi:hypothetical protein
MSKLIALLVGVILLSIAGSCDADYKDWSEKEKKQYNTYIALQVMDTAQTIYLINCQKSTQCPFRELNPILGSHPRKAEVIALKAIGNFIIFKVLDKAAKRSRNIMVLNIVSSIVVTHNGIQLRRRF